MSTQVSQTSKPFFSRNVRALLTVVLLGSLMFGSSGCFIRKLQAKDRLNTGVRLFNAGKYDLAEKAFQEAKELNPSLMQAHLFYATALRSRVLNEEGENQTETARRAIEAYKQLLNPEYQGKLPEKDRDQVYAFIADLYKTLDDTNSYREWLQKRADLPSQKEVTKSDCLYGIGVTYWNIATKASKKYEFAVPGKPSEFKKPNEWSKEDIEELTQSVQKGLMYMDKAISVYPKYTNAYSYRSLLLKEQIKVETDPEKIKTLEKTAQEANEKFQELNRQEAAELQQKESGT
jgi:tetratricopeptide (TPR) repeat protein